MRKLDILIGLLFQIELVTCLLDPVSLGIGVTSLISYFGYKYYNKCNTNECCTDNWLPLNTTGKKKFPSIL